MQRGEKKGERGVGFYQQVLEDAHVRRLLRRGGLLHLEVQMRLDVLDLVLGVNALLDTVEMKQAPVNLGREPCCFLSSSHSRIIDDD